MENIKKCDYFFQETKINKLFVALLGICFTVLVEHCTRNRTYSHDS